MKYLYAFAVLACAAVAITEGIVCPENACANITCQYVSRLGCACKDGIYEERGTSCGCCPACLTKIHKGEDCGFLFLFAGGPTPPTSACENGTTCQQLELNNSTSFKCL